MMIGSDPQHITFARAPQRLFDVAETINSICRNPGERNARRDRPVDHLHRQCRFGGKGRGVRDMSGGEPFRITGPVFRQIQRTIDKGMATRGFVAKRRESMTALLREDVMRPVRSWAFLFLRSD
jgi:hypothetical protein